MFNGLMVAVIAIGLSILFEDKIVIILSLTIIIMIMRLIYDVVKHKINLFILNIVILLLAIAALVYHIEYGIEFTDTGASNKGIKIVKFSPLKKEYNVDENIGFEIQSNSDGYYYLHTQKEGTSKMILLKIESDNSLQKDKSKKVGYFRIKNFVGDERALLTVCNTPYKKFEKNIEESVYKKEFEYVGGIEDDAEEKETRCTQREIKVKVKAPQEEINITTQSSNYRLGEDIDFRVNSATDGYVVVFDAAPMDNINKLYEGSIQKLRDVQMGIVAKRPLGHRIAIAIYSRENENIGINSFDIIEAESMKGQPQYKLEFKDGKQYIYNMQYYTVSD